jgi:tetratricopeptide (TPR) repeat protein
LIAARAAAQNGFSRSAVRLAAAAVQLDPSTETRKTVAEITRGMAKKLPKLTPPPGTVPRAEPEPGIDRKTAPEIDWTPKRPSYANVAEALAASVEEEDQPTDVEVIEPELAEEEDEAAMHAQIVARAVEAIRARDFDEVERCAEFAIAAGGPRAAAERIRAMAQLARGDAGAAMRILARSRSTTIDQDARAEARAALALALALLSSGDASQAIRSALGALATSRATRDPRGEAASLHTLAMCYRALGRKDDAMAIDDVSPG